MQNRHDGVGMRRIGAWLVVVPLMLGGTEVAHALAYRIVYPQAAVRWHVLETTGHRYLAWAPLFFGILAALVLAGLVAGVVDAVRGRAPRPVPPWLFGLLPFIGFAIQEFVERWLALGGLPWWMVEQPTFRIGLALQLPFALVAFLLARFLLRTAEQVGLALRPASLPPVQIGTRRSWPVVAGSLRRLAALAAGHAERGPPVVARALPAFCR
jgi:hypothetical protein